jgi:hypothetical protein
VQTLLGLFVKCSFPLVLVQKGESNLSRFHGLLYKSEFLISTTLGSMACQGKGGWEREKSTEQGQRGLYLRSSKLHHFKVLRITKCHSYFGVSGSDSQLLSYFNMSLVFHCLYQYNFTLSRSASLGR